MDIQVKYYKTQNENNSVGLFITSRTEYWLERVRLSIHPPLGEEINCLFDDIQNVSIILGFDKIDSDIFNSVITEISKKNVITDLGIHNSVINVNLDSTLLVDKLYIGESTTMDLDSAQIDAKEITFLSLKTFKGFFLSKFPNVQSLTIWEDKNRINELLEVFFNIKELILTSSNVEILDFKLVMRLNNVDLRYCNKLTSIEVGAKHKIQRLIVQKSKNYFPSINLQHIVKIFK